MARGFGSTFGTSGTTDVLTGGSSITPGTTFSLFGWYNRNGFGPSGFGTPFAINAGGLSTVAIAQNGDGANMYFHRLWTNFPTWTFANPTGSLWFALGISYDGGSTANVPVVYVNGSTVAVTTATAPTGSLVSTAAVPTIGNFGGGDNNFCWDGKLAEFAMWNNALLTANEHAALAKGATPRLIRPASLNLYAPMYGNQTNEQDFGSARMSMTVTGALRQNHAPVRRLLLAA